MLFNLAKSRYFFLALLCLVFATASNSLADTISVSAKGSYDNKSLKLKDNEAAKIEVYLMSAGEPVGGFEVALYRDEDAERIETLVSDDHGIVVFNNLEAKHYTIALLRSEQMRLESTVAIGDFFIKAYDKNKKTIIEKLTNKKGH